MFRIDLKTVLEMEGGLFLVVQLFEAQLAHLECQRQPALGLGDQFAPASQYFEQFFPALLLPQVRLKRLEQLVIVAIRLQGFLQGLHCLVNQAVRFESQGRCEIHRRPLGAGGRSARPAQVEVGHLGCVSHQLLEALVSLFTGWIQCQHPFEGLFSLLGLALLYPDVAQAQRQAGRLRFVRYFRQFEQAACHLCGLVPDLS